MLVGDLRPVHQSLLAVLIRNYDERGEPVKATVLADAVDDSVETVQRQIQTLVSLQLVEGVAGVPGAQSGYRPTADGYTVADSSRVDQPVAVPITRGGENIGGRTVTAVRLPSPADPDPDPDPADREARIGIAEGVRDFVVGDEVTVGPTPTIGLVVSGTVTGVETGESVVAIAVDSIQS